MPRRRVLMEHLAMQARIRARRALGRLAGQRVQHKTFEKYVRAVQGFNSWLSFYFGRMPQSMMELDEMAAEYLEHMWEEGGSQTEAGYVLSGITFFIHRRHVLDYSWSLLRVWRKLEVPLRAPPVTPEMVLAVAGAAMMQNMPLDAVAILCMFYAALRTMEALTLSPANILFTYDYSAAIFTLPWTKRGQVRGQVEQVQVKDLGFVRIICRVLWNVKPDQRLVTTTPGAFRLRFDQYLRMAYLNPSIFRPYSCRRGGATELFRQTQNWDAVCEFGRWQQVSTARIYVQEGLAFLAEARATPELQHHWARLANFLLV